MSNKACTNCQSPMSFIDYNRNPYCQQPNCQRALAQVVSINKAQAFKEKIVAQCKERAKCLAELPTYEKIPVKLLDYIKQNTPVFAIMPVNKNILTESPEARKNVFLSHLSALFNDIKTESAKELPIYNNKLETPLPKEESALLGYACATCKGHCCSLGDTHAFQDYPSLEHYLSTQPADLSEDELIEAYRSYMPTQSYKNACIFQGNQGCTLPRNMRSFTCNNYRCEKLNSYRQQVATSDSKLTYAVAVDHEKIVGSSVFNVEHFARHR